MRYPGCNGRLEFGISTTNQNRNLSRNVAVPPLQALAREFMTRSSWAPPIRIGRNIHRLPHLVNNLLAFNTAGFGGLSP
jgi:hypothetical protein